MKRKVAAKGRRGGEFSWSMSVKTGRKGITEALLRPQTCGRLRMFLSLFRNLFRADADALGQTPNFQRRRETHGAVLRMMPTLQIADRANQAT